MFIVPPGSVLSLGQGEARDEIDLAPAHHPTRPALLVALFLARNDTSWPATLMFGPTFSMVSLTVRQVLIDVLLVEDQQESNA